MHKLLKKRVFLKDKIEHDMYIDCGPDGNDCRELDLTESAIRDKENEFIIEYYRTEVGRLAAEVDRYEVERLEMHDFSNTLKHILGENNIKWHDHQLYKDHRKKIDTNYFKKEENR
tara:strand:+ start:138 stop:485 length:348 start_codon:yes stop_codon:yes gene_type:complete